MENFEKLNLKKVDVVGNIIGKFSTFSIHQEYRNDTDTVKFEFFLNPLYYDE